MMDERVTTVLTDDPALEPYVEQFGPLGLQPAEDSFERLAISLIRQQVSTDAAEAIRQRLFDAIEVTPDGVLAADDETLREAGLSEAKAEYLNAVADAFQREGYDRQYFDGMANEAVLDELTAIRGVGPWTGKMFLLFALGRPDVFPVEDLGIRHGIEIVCGREMTRAEMRGRAERWAPYRSYASLYLWRAYEG
jgi:DNA-3-methyladenine glycosylase II